MTRKEKEKVYCNLLKKKQDSVAKKKRNKVIGSLCKNVPTKAQRPRCSSETCVLEQIVKHRSHDQMVTFNVKKQFTVANRKKFSLKKNHCLKTLTFHMIN